MSPYRSLFVLMDSKVFLWVVIGFMRFYLSLLVLIVPYASIRILRGSCVLMGSYLL